MPTTLIIVISRIFKQRPTNPHHRNLGHSTSRMHEHTEAKRPPEPPPSLAEAGQMDPQPVEIDEKPPASPAELSQTGSECVICTDTITDPCEVRPCAHRHFDYLCVATWLFSDARCPVCRTAVDSLVRDSTGEALTDFQAPTPTLDLHPRPSSSSSSSRHRRPWPRVPLQGHPYRRYRSWDAAPEEPSTALRRRQEVYLHGRYSKHVGSNRLSRYRELTPALFREDEQLVSRARMWIRRELQVFSFLRPGASESSSSSDRDAASRRRHQNAEFLLEYVVAILKSVDLAGSAGEAENMLSEFLGRDNTRLFLHELRAWLRSPFTRLEDWDRAVQYEKEGSRGSQLWRGDDRREEVVGRFRTWPMEEEAERTGSRRRRFSDHEERPDKRRRGYDRYVPSSAAGSHSRRQ